MQGRGSWGNPAAGTGSNWTGHVPNNLNFNSNQLQYPNANQYQPRQPTNFNPLGRSEDFSLDKFDNGPMTQGGGGLPAYPQRSAFLQQPKGVQVQRQPLLHQGQGPISPQLPFNQPQHQQFSQQRAQTGYYPQNQRQINSFSQPVSRQTFEAQGQRQALSQQQQQNPHAPVFQLQNQQQSLAPQRNLAQPHSGFGSNIPTNHGFGSDMYYGKGPSARINHPNAQNDLENPFVNPNPLPFFEPPQSQKLNPVVQQNQQVFTLKWQTPDTFAKKSNSPPPPCPKDESKLGNAPPLPPTTDGVSGAAGKIVSTNILGLMDIINGTKKQEDDSIPGLDPRPDSPKVEPEPVEITIDHIQTNNELPLTKTNSCKEPEIVEIKDSPSERTSCSSKKPAEVLFETNQKFPKIMQDNSSAVPDDNFKFKTSFSKAPGSTVSNTSSQISTKSTTGELPQFGQMQKDTFDQKANHIPFHLKDFSFKQSKPLLQPDVGMGTGTNQAPLQPNRDFENIPIASNAQLQSKNIDEPGYNSLTLRAFNTKLKEWEKSFEEWKRANANHPDQSTYDKYLGQWESFREKLFLQRKFILDNIARAGQNDTDEGIQPNNHNQPQHQMGRTQMNTQQSDNIHGSWRRDNQDFPFSIPGPNTSTYQKSEREPVWETRSSYTDTRPDEPKTNFFPTSGPLNQFSLRSGVRPQLDQHQVPRNASTASNQFYQNNELLNYRNKNVPTEKPTNQFNTAREVMRMNPSLSNNASSSNTHNLSTFCGNTESQRLIGDQVPRNPPSALNEDFAFSRKPDPVVQEYPSVPSNTMLDYVRTITGGGTNINELFTRDKNEARDVDLGKIVEETTLPDAVTIDYGHGAKQPEIDRATFNKDWEAEEYESYNDRYEEHIKVTPIQYHPQSDRTLIRENFDPHEFRRRPEFPFREDFLPQQNSFPPSNIPIDESLPRRDSKHLFPIVDYDIPTRIAPPANNDEPQRIRHAPPANDDELHRIRQAPPRDLEPISPENSPVVIRIDRGLLPDDDLPRKRSNEKYRGRSRSRSRERVSRRRSSERSRSRDRIRSRDRSEEKYGRCRTSSKSERRERSPLQRGSSQTHSRSGRSPDRRSSNAVARRPSSHDCRYGSVIVEDILNLPGRKKRPPQIVIIFRGLPGSGKTHVAKLIKDREIEFGESAPRILSLDDYFTEEHDKLEKDPVTGKEVKTKVSQYVYDPALERKYSDDLFKAFRKTVEAGLFRFIIVDCVNDKIRHFQEMANFAKARRFQVYIAEMDGKPEECVKRNIHHRTLEEIKKLEKGWDRTPSHLVKLDVRTLLQEEAIPHVEMEDVSDTEINEDSKKSKQLEGSAADADPDEDEEQGPWAPSKWETSDEMMNKLDGLCVKRKKSGYDDEKELPPTKSLDDWLKSHIREDYISAVVPGKKRVRWKDIEQRREQERSRDIGFVVGQTDWGSMTDPSSASSALTQIKYI